MGVKIRTGFHNKILASTKPIISTCMGLYYINIFYKVKQLLYHACRRDGTLCNFITNCKSNIFQSWKMQSTLKYWFRCYAEAF